MGYAILWLLHLLFVFFLTVFAVAAGARCKTSVSRRFWSVISVLLSFLTTVVYAVAGGMLIYRDLQPSWLFWFGLSLSLSFLAGVGFIVKWGIRPSAGAATWPRFKPAVASLFFLSAYFLVGYVMESRIMIETTNVHLKAAANLSRLLPGPVPEYQNARTYYDRAIGQFQPDRDTSDWLNRAGSPEFDVTADKVKQLLDEQAEVMAMTKTAAELSSYNLASGAADFYSWPIPNYSNYRNLARLFVLSAKQKSLKGDGQGAMADLVIIEKMAAHIRQSPMLISFMVARVLDQARVNTLEHILAQAGAGRFLDENLPFQIPTTVFPEYQRSIQVEGYGQLQGFASIASTAQGLQDAFYGTGPVSAGQRITAMLWRIFLLPSDLKGAQKITGAMVKQAADYQEMKENLTAINEAFKAGEFGVFTAMATPQVSSYGQRAKQYDAQNSLSVLALALAAYKSKTGQYPADLTILVPDFIDSVPKDPFDMPNPLKIKHMLDGVDLYSRGPDKASGIHDAGPIHFYLGKVLYYEQRIAPALEKNTRPESGNTKKK